MGDKTEIQWTDATWNPVRGCSRVSEGCRNCYAEGVAARFSGPGLAYQGLARQSDNGPRWTGKLVMVPEHLDDPIRWKRPRRIFVNSMSDLFHEKLSNEQIASVFRTMLAAPRHTFQVLTKRAERMHEFVRWFYGTSGLSGIPGHIWLGVSAEDQKNAEARVPWLRRTPAAVRFVSAEPLLGPIDFSPWMMSAVDRARRQGDAYWAFTRQAKAPPPSVADPEAYTPGIDWVIIGGESGREARPYDIDWARRIIAACDAAGVHAFHKQFGAKPFDSTGRWKALNFHPMHGPDIAEWPAELQVREYPVPRSP